MPCNNCDHTMQNLGLDTAGRRSFWCNRCDSVKTVARDGFESFESPMIVERATAFRNNPYGTNPSTDHALKECLKKGDVKGVNWLEGARITEYEFADGSTITMDTMGVWEAYAPDQKQPLAEVSGGEMFLSFATPEQAAALLAAEGYGSAKVLKEGV